MRDGRALLVGFRMEAAKKRFKAIKNGDVLVMEGPITDTTVFTVLDDFKGLSVAVDLNKIDCASYSGVNNLLAKLTSSSITYKFSNVPFKIHQVLVLTEGRSSIESFFDRVACVNGDLKIAFNEVKSQCDAGGGNIQAVQSDGSISLAYRSYTGMDMPESRGFLCGWSAENAEESAFWVDYLGFFANILVQCEQIIASTTISITRLLKMLDIRIQSFAAAWQTMGLPDRRGEWKGQASIDEVAKTAETVLGAISSSVTKSQMFLARILIELQAENHSQDSIIDLLEQLSAYISSQEEAAKTIEDVGCALGDLLMSIEMFNHIRADLSLVLNKIDEDKMATVLEQLGVMNPMAESDPDEARSEILSESALAQNDINSGVVMTQAYDLVRQIMEHRRAEVNIILENLKEYRAGNAPWAYLRDLVIDKLTSKMVTDQEKKAFEFYLGYHQPAQSDKASAPGDVELF